MVVRFSGGRGVPLYGGFVRIMGQLPVDRQDKELNQRSRNRPNQ